MDSLYWRRVNAVMKPSYVVDAVLVGYLPIGKFGKFEMTIFYFLQTDKQNSCYIIVRGKAVNQGDGKGMKVPRCL